MKQFFEEYGSVVIVLIVITVLLAVLGSATMTDGGAVTGNGLAAVVSKSIADTINKFTTQFGKVVNAIKIPEPGAAGQVIL